jgi:hypothetical protein
VISKRRCLEANLLVLVFILLGQPTWPRQVVKKSESSVTSGTLNLLLANKNGFVIAADSRVSSEVPFLCPDTSQLQLHCDNSQKLFRTSPNSAVVIAGFAVGGRNSPLNLAIASVLLKKFGPHGLANDDQAKFAPDQIKNMLSQALRNVAALRFPFDPQHFDPQILDVTFARVDRSSGPAVRVLEFRETLKLSAPLQVYVPEFEIVQDTGEVPIKTFVSVSLGLPYVAQAILAGYWKSTDPVILDYYQKKKNGQRDSMPLAEMRKLTVAILHETGRYVTGVGGEDQIGVFPAAGDSAEEFTLPKNLPSEAQSIPHVLGSVGLDCSATPPCNGAISFTIDPTQPYSPYQNFYLASRFRGLQIALENNIFIGNNFDGVTFLYHGGNPYLLHNAVTNCTLEVPQAMPVPNIPDLQVCRIVKKAVVGYSLDTFGARRVWDVGPGIFIQPQP